MCCKRNVLREELLQEECVARGLCCKRYVLQEVCVTSGMCCKRYVLQAVCVTSGMCYKRYAPSSGAKQALPQLDRMVHAQIPTAQYTSGKAGKLCTGKAKRPIQYEVSSELHTRTATRPPSAFAATWWCTRTCSAYSHRGSKLTIGQRLVSGICFGGSSGRLNKSHTCSPSPPQGLRPKQR